MLFVFGPKVHCKWKLQMSIHFSFLCFFKHPARLFYESVSFDVSDSTKLQRQILEGENRQKLSADTLLTKWVTRQPY